MADSPKTLSDVKALLEEAVQVVTDLEATAATDASGANDANPAVSPEDADDQAVEADKAQLSADEAKDQADDATEPAEQDAPAPPTA